LVVLLKLLRDSPPIDERGALSMHLNSKANIKSK